MLGGLSMMESDFWSSVAVGIKKKKRQCRIDVKHHDIPGGSPYST